MSEETITVTNKKAEKEVISIQKLRDAIPDHCFKPIWYKSLGYIIRDVFFAIALAMIAWEYIPKLPFSFLRFFAWISYGTVQGFVFTGLWEIAHELGHGSFLSSQLANNVLGLVLHSVLLTPFFSWRSTHRKHHRYTAHMEKDHNHIPSRYSEYLVSASRQKEIKSVLSQVHEYIEDAPLYVLSRLVFQQVLGMPLYFLFSIASAPSSSEYRHNKWMSSLPAWISKNHYNPFASLFSPEETIPVLLSDFGLATVTGLLWIFGKHHGFLNVFLMYGQPWLWVNHWIVGITFLHHTHPQIPKYEAEAWTYVKGATATIDRDAGFVGKFFFHNVADYHVVHHLFTHIPFYHTKEATDAIRPVLGDAYHRDNTNYVYALWRDFSKCQWLKPDDAERSEDRALWFVDRKGQFTNRVGLT